MAEARFIGKTLFAVGGLLAWGGQFGAVYAVNALACARGFADRAVLGFGLVPVAVGAATLLAAAAAVLVLFLALRRRGPARASREGEPVDEFLRSTTITVAVLALVAIAWTGLPALLVPPCG